MFCVVAFPFFVWPPTFPPPNPLFLNGDCCGKPCVPPWLYRASLPQVIENGEVLVDGGVMDNFPISLMAERCESDHIIGVNIMPYAYKQRPYDLETDISGWRILLNRLNPFSKRLCVPSLIGTMMRIGGINGLRQSKVEEALADVIIHPDVKKFSIMDYPAFAQIIQAGYEAALGVLKDWQAKRLSH